MFKYCFILIITFASLQSYSQTIDSIKHLVLQKKLIEAKTAIENLLAIKENLINADAWYFKGYTYNLLSKDSTFSVPLTNIKAIAFNAFVTCLSIAPKHKWLEKDNYKPIINIYATFFEDGKMHYQQGNYENALDDFVNAEKVEQFLYQNNITINKNNFPKLDTNLIFNIATTALKAKKEKESIIYYTKIADAHLKDPNYLFVYHTIVEYYISIYDEIGFRKYLRIGQKLFPYDNYWIQAELDMAKASNLNNALIKEYELKLIAQPNNFDIMYGFCKDLMQIIFYSETKPRYYDDIKLKLETNLQKCLTLQKSGTNTEFLLSQFYYKLGIAVDTTTMDETLVKLKTTLFEKSLPFAIIVFNNYESKQRLSKYELEILKIVLQNIIDINIFLKKEEDVKFYKEKQKIIETIIPVLITKKPI